MSKGTGGPARGRGIAYNPYWELVRVPADGGAAVPVVRMEVSSGGARSQVARGRWGPDGRVFFTDGAPEGTRGTGLFSVAPDGTDRTHHLTLRWADEMALSPDGDWLAFQEGDNVYVSPFPYGTMAGEALDLAKASGKVPVTQLSTEGGLYPTWRDNGTLDFGSGPHFYSHRPADE